MRMGTGKAGRRIRDAHHEASHRGRGFLRDLNSNGAGTDGNAKGGSSAALSFRGEINALERDVVVDVAVARAAAAVP
jgi:hypothetical protein